MPKSTQLIRTLKGNVDWTLPFSPTLVNLQECSSKVWMKTPAVIRHICLLILTRKPSFGAGEMVWGLRALWLLQRTPGLIPSTHMETHSHL